MKKKSAWLVTTLMLILSNTVYSVDASKYFVYQCPPAGSSGFTPVEYNGAMQFMGINAIYASQPNVTCGILASNSSGCGTFGGDEFPFWTAPPAFTGAKLLPPASDSLPAAIICNYQIVSGPAGATVTMDAFAPNNQCIFQNHPTSSTCTSSSVNDCVVQCNRSP